MALLVAGGVQYAGDHPPKRRAASTQLLARASRILGETEIGRRPQQEEVTAQARERQSILAKLSDNGASNSVVDPLVTDPRELR